MTNIPTDHIVNQQYDSYIQPSNQNIFQILNSRLQHADEFWYKKKILDFGCNVGHLLRYSEGLITDYTGVDVQENALDIAKRDYPFSKWIHYDGYHPAFNSHGNAEFPQLSEKYDYIFCIGVFTHCDVSMIEKMLEYFETMLSESGSVIFSIWEQTHWPLYSKVFLPKHFNINLPEAAFQDFSNHIYLIDRKYTIVDESELDIRECTWIETFYKREFINSHFKAHILDGQYSKHSIFKI